MRGLTSGLLGLCGAGLIAAGIFWAGRRIEPIEPAATIEPAREQAETAAPSAAHEQPARSVASDMVVPAVPEDAALERVAPRAPLSPPEEEDRTPRPTLLHRPVAPAAGRIEAGGHRIEIAGLRVTEPDRTCGRESGGTWPCGAAARTAFRNWLRGRAVECLVPEKPLEDSVTVSCSLGKADVGLWLAAQGFAEAAEGGPYAESMKAAQAARRGIWGDGPARD